MERTSLCQERAVRNVPDDLSEMKELTLEMKVDMLSAVLLMGHAVEVSAWTSRVHADAVGR